MRKMMLCLAVVSVCALFPGVVAAQEKQLPDPQQVVAPAGASICDMNPDNLADNCGWDTGTYAPWVRSGDPSFTEINATARHSGPLGLFIGPVVSLGFVTQQIPTTPGSFYDLTFWLRNAQTPNRFQVSWNGAIIYDQTNMPNFNYTFSDNLPVGDTSVFYGLEASDGDTTELQFGFFNVPDFFYHDDVELVEEVFSRR